MSIEAVGAVLNAEISLGSTTKLVLVGLANHADPDGAQAFPSIARLSRYAGVEPRNVQRALRRLEKAGLITLVAEATGQRAREYCLDLAAIRGVTVAPPLESATPDAGVTPGVAEASPGGVAEASPRTVLGTVPQPSKNDIDQMFETWWAIYPRRVGKRGARLEFERALRRGTFVDLCAGAERYRDDPGRTAQFTAHPKTWLHQDRWLDEAADDGLSPEAIAERMRRRREKEDPDDPR